jgi:hypothetical protein
MGVGGLIGNYVQSRLQHRAQIGQLEHELKQKRYLCILVLMLTKLNPDVGLARARAIRPDLQKLDDIDVELDAELLNGYVFAGDTVLETLSSFIREPSHRSFVNAAVAMRQDLWGKGTNADARFLDVISATKKH